MPQKPRPIAEDPPTLASQGDPPTLDVPPTSEAPPHRRSSSFLPRELRPIPEARSLSSGYPAHFPLSSAPCSGLFQPISSEVPPCSGDLLRCPPPSTFPRPRPTQDATPTFLLRLRPARRPCVLLPQRPRLTQDVLPSCLRPRPRRRPLISGRRSWAPTL